MQLHIESPLVSFAAVTLGAAIGLVFGLVEERIRLRKERRAVGQPVIGVGSGTMRRTAYLLAGLVIVQGLCPVLFANGQQWSVSAGLLAGYGLFLYRGYLRKKRELGA